MTLNAVQFQAAQLLAEGKTEIQTAEMVGKSHSWVQKLKTQPDFQEALEDCKKQLMGIIKEAGKEDLLQEIREHRARLKRATDLIHSVSFSLLQKIEKRVAEIEDDDLPAKSITQNFKQAIESLSIGVNLENQMIGIDKLVGQMEEIDKLMGK
ncbi:hypothetical protein [Nodularia spumigena]|uniref:hypothetical protein n=1 Tax=Nodularia spumigena TaxID=70799 RepID=UPI002B20016B|nr:hypothetical protein [Nodularia spumigena]MEA5559070.1 hypothetical protein [Nodularia spumigena CH309]